MTGTSAWGFVSGNCRAIFGLQSWTRAAAPGTFAMTAVLSRSIPNQNAAPWVSRRGGMEDHFNANASSVANFTAVAVNAASVAAETWPPFTLSLMSVNP